jgi:HEAT repeat protein
MQRTDVTGGTPVLTGAWLMRREPVYYAIIAMGVVAGAWAAYLTLKSNWAGAKATPEQLALQLKDGGSDPALRRAAATQLAQTGPEAAPVLREILAKTGESSDVRAAAADGLGVLRDEASMGDLLTALEDPDPLVRGRAGVAIQRILGADYFFRAEDPVERRRECIENIKSDWALLQGAPGRRGR